MNPNHDELGRFSSGPGSAPRAVQKQVMRAMEYNQAGSIKGLASKAAKIVGTDRGMKLKAIVTRVSDKVAGQVARRPMAITQLRGVGDVGSTYSVKIVKISGR